MAPPSQITLGILMVLTIAVMGLTIYNTTRISRTDSTVDVLVKKDPDFKKPPTLLKGRKKKSSSKKKKKKSKPKPPSYPYTKNNTKKSNDECKKGMKGLNLNEKEEKMKTHKCKYPYDMMENCSGLDLACAGRNKKRREAQGLINTKAEDSKSGGTQEEGDARNSAGGIC